MFTAWAVLCLAGVCVHEEECCDCGHHHLWPALQPGAEQPPLWAALLRPQHPAGCGELLVWSAVCLPEHTPGYGTAGPPEQPHCLFWAHHSSSSCPKTWTRLYFFTSTFTFGVLSCASQKKSWELCPYNSVKLWCTHGKALLPCWKYQSWQ